MGIIHRLSLALVFLASASAVRVSALRDSSARAQDAEVDVPVAPLHFSQLVGKYRISSSAAPAEVRVEEPITLKVRIIGQGPEKYHPQRKNLQIFPEELADNFHLEAVPEEDRLVPAKGIWEFYYRLRPKHAKVSVIPGLRLLYYAPDSERFQSSFADEVPIKVTPREEVTPEKLNLKVVEAPARFYQLRPVEDVLRDDTPMPPPGPGLLAVLVALPPVLCFGWYRVWRRLHPNAAESRQRRRSRAARLALAYLEKQTADIPRTRAAAVDFLRQRLDLPALEATPHEVARHLTRLGIAKPLVADWAAFLRACDRFRFAHAPDPPERPLNAEATRLINAVEVDPCVI